MRNIQWNVQSIFSRPFTMLIFEALHSGTPYTIILMSNIQAWISKSKLVCHLLEATFVPMAAFHIDPSFRFDTHEYRDGQSYVMDFTSLFQHTYHPLRGTMDRQSNAS